MSRIRDAYHSALERVLRARRLYSMFEVYVTDNGAVRVFGSGRRAGNRAPAIEMLVGNYRHTVAACDVMADIEAGLIERGFEGFGVQP